MYPNEYLAQALRQQQVDEHLQRQAVEQIFRANHPELGERLMDGAGNVLIALGKRMKPRRKLTGQASLYLARQAGTRSR